MSRENIALILQSYLGRRVFFNKMTKKVLGTDLIFIVQMSSLSSISIINLVFIPPDPSVKIVGGDQTKNCSGWHCFDIFMINFARHLNKIKQIPEEKEFPSTDSAFPCLGLNTALMMKFLPEINKQSRWWEHRADIRLEIFILILTVISKVEANTL